MGLLLKGRRGEDGRGKKREGKGRVGLLQLGTLDTAVEEEREGRKAGRKVGVGSSWHFFFPL